jgi:hypothetical protein
MIVMRIAAAALAVAVASGASAQGRELPHLTPKIFTDVTDCRKIADASERLACFDRTVATLETAQRAKDVYIADKATMAETRRGLFGFNLPRVRIFGDNDLGEDVKSIEAKIRSVSPGQKGYVFILEDGAKWAQTDGAYMDRPKAGSTIRIRRAALGSYMASIEGRVGFRIERLNN